MSRKAVWWLAIVLALSVTSIVLSERRTTDPIQNLSLTVASPVEAGLRDIASPLGDIFEGITNRGELVRENERLKQEIEALRSQLGQQQDLQERIQELEAALQIKQSRPEDQLLAARVIAEDPSGHKRAVAIDRGLADGVDEGMVVLSLGENGSLVGTVSRAYQNFAWVRLITDPDSAVNAQINVTVGPPSAPAPSQVLTPGTPAPSATPAPSPTLQPTPPSPVRGVAEGDLRQGLVLDLLPSDVDIAEGSLVLTSGLGGNYPSALLIGTVKGLERRPQSPFTRATVEPAADLSHPETVFVLISFKPARLTPP